MTIGEKIKEARDSFGLSQEELAKKAGISRTYVIQLENNHSTKPSAVILFNVAKALGTTIGELLGKVEVMDSDGVELPASLKAALTAYPELQSVQKDLVGWKYRGKYPSTSEEWFGIYIMMKKYTSK